MKSVHATQTFSTQAEALDYIERRQTNEKNVQNVNESERKKQNERIRIVFIFQGEILYLFSFESQPDGRRRYQVADINIFIDEY